MRQKDTGLIGALVFIPLFLLFNTRHVFAALPKHFDDASLNFCKMALAITPGSANILNSLAPRSVAAAMNMKVDRQLDLVADVSEPEAIRTRAFNKMLSLSDDSDGFLSESEILSRILLRIGELRFTKAISEKFIALVKDSVVNDIPIQNEFVRLLQDPKGLKDGITHLTVQVALLELGLGRGLTAESADYLDDLPKEEQVDVVKETAPSVRRAQILVPSFSSLFR